MLSGAGIWKVMEVIYCFVGGVHNVEFAECGGVTLITVVCVQSTGL